MNILIVDDNKDVSSVLRNILQLERYDVRVAANGAEALEMAKDSLPDILISDILMPEMDGFKLCHEIKKNKKLRKTAFIFYTAHYTDPEDEKLALTMGASRFILKPMDPEEFINVIKEVIVEHNKTELHVPRMPLEEDEDLFRMYNRRLTKMLDKKISDLETLDRSLRQKEDSLQASEEKYHKLIETANDAIFVADAETGIILEANKKAGELLDLPVDKIIGMHQSGLHPIEEAERYSNIFREHVHAQRVISEKLLIVNRSKQRVPVEISASVTEVKGRRIIQGIFRDISDRVQMERKLQDKVRELEKFYEMAVGRELKMKELKEEVVDLRSRLSKCSTDKL